MRLTKLELYGFKSFAKKTEILFDKGITAIVGPNGSGKSNIADAIRWVLGEQSAKTLRGSRMEDCIFGGTAQRRAMSYCEVTLTFDNSDGDLPIDYAEVSITRRVFRSGDSEYCINKANCRLRDIQELFRDTGLGKEGYSIVGQGRVEEILSNKSGERRKAFEEAAGIMKYRVRKEEAERNLDNTRKNLVRLEDLLSDMEERLEPMAEQAQKAQEYLRLRDELRDLEINLFLYQYDKVRERIAAIDETLKQIQEETEETEKVRSQLAQECAEAEEKERECSDRLNAKNNELVEKTAGLEQLIGEQKVVEEKIQGSEREHENLLERIRANTARRDEITSLLSGQDERANERDLILKKLREEHEEKLSELEKINKQTADTEQHVEDLKTEMFNAANRLGDTKSRISALQATIAGLEERLAKSDDENDSNQTEAEKLQEEFTEAKNELSDCEEKAQELAEKRDEALTKSNENTVRRNQTEEEIRRTEQLLENKKARYSALMDMKRAHDGYYASIQKLLSDAEVTPWLKKDIEGTVAELIQVPQEYEVAIEMAMGATLQNIVTPDEEAAKAVVRYLRENRYGRATFLPVTNMRPRTVTPDERRKMQGIRGYIGIASELIGFSERHRGVVENLLGRTIIVDNLDTGVLINRATGQSMRIATLDGDIINPGGSITGGSIGKSLNLLGRERECADLLAEISRLKKELSELIDRRNETDEKQSELMQHLSECSRACHDTDIELAKLRDKVDIIEQQLKKAIAKRFAADEEKRRLQESCDDARAQLKEAQETMTELSGGSTTTQRDIIDAQKELSALREAQSKCAEEETDIRIRIAALEKEADAISGEHMRLEREAKQLSEAIEADIKRERNFAFEQQNLDDRRKELCKQIEEKRSQNSELNDACKALEAERAELLQKLDELRAKKQTEDDRADELRERKHRQELSRTKSENELETMQNRMWEDYELTYENALCYRKQIPITSSTQRATEIKRAIRDLGEINVNAIEDYKTLSEKYNSTKTQCEDLRKAEADLLSLIGELIHTMEDNFREKFEQIRMNFKVVFSELFGGGEADLTLADKNDILNCDIDILAQIPGKKLQSLAPLSGGERALTAIALQFAILGLKPTAFCLLDEIDASLDEINVSRFANYIHKYAQSTQFILITHRKGSMEACNAIYGVAQEEKGVSKVVSARFETAE